MQASFFPDGSMLSPDAAYILPEKLKALKKDDLAGFPRLCPDFVVELLSASDSLPNAKVKMERWIETEPPWAGSSILTSEKSMSIKPAQNPPPSPQAHSRKGSCSRFLSRLDELWRCYEIKL